MKSLLAASLFAMPMVAISLVDADRQWFLASRGLGGLCETPRSVAFCAHTIAADAVLVVPDASADARFSANPLVVGPPAIRFYAAQRFQRNGSDYFELEDERHENFILWRDVMPEAEC